MILNTNESTISEPGSSIVTTISRPQTDAQITLITLSTSSSSRVSSTITSSLMTTQAFFGKIKKYDYNYNIKHI